MHWLRQDVIIPKLCKGWLTVQADNPNTERTPFLFGRWPDIFMRDFAQISGAIVVAETGEEVVGKMRMFVSKINEVIHE